MTAAQVTLRPVVESDLDIFYAHQRDPDACAMAAFPAREREAFIVHWRTKVLGNDAVVKRTILVDDAIAGSATCYEQDGRHLVGYWIGPDFWGDGVATRALTMLIAEIDLAKLFAYVATTNVGSIRVLEKCGFARIGESVGADGVAEYLYALARG